MITELIDSIKSDKKLSFDHWRFKTLHWCFGINPASPWQSPLPQYLYTKYCPLFHLTNLIVIFCIPIFFIKVLTFVVKKLVYGVAFLCETFLGPLFEKVICSFLNVSSLDEHVINKQLDLLNSYVDQLNRKFSSLQKFADQISYIVERAACLDTLYLKCIEKGEKLYNIEELYKRHLANIEKSKNQQKEEKKALNDKVLFAVRAGEFLVKGFLKLAYGLLVCMGGVVSLGLLYVLFNLIKFFSIYSYYNAASMLYLISSALGVMAVAALILYLVFKVFSKQIMSFVDMIFMWLREFGFFINRKLDIIVEFISVFYKDNCPSIEVVVPEKSNPEKV